jgi:hypothetical protein
MRRLSILMMVVALAFAGCEIFFPKVGGEGQPCADNGACEGNLVCNFDECVTPRDEGDECDDSWVRDQDWTAEDADELPWLDSFAVCDEGLCCDDGECAEDGELVRQPGTDLYWSRCPEGVGWEGCRCQGEVYDWNAGSTNNTVYYDTFCLSDWELPSRDELVALLGGCDDEVEAGGEGFCDSCEENEECAAMFTFLNAEDDLVLFTSTYTVDNEPYTGDISDAWFVDLKTGEGWEEDVSIAFFDAVVLCLQHH